MADSDLDEKFVKFLRLIFGILQAALGVLGALFLSVAAVMATKMSSLTAHISDKDPTPGVFLAGCASDASCAWMMVGITTIGIAGVLFLLAALSVSFAKAALD